MADACAVEDEFAAGSASGPAIGQLSCSMASTLVRYVRTTLGEEAVDQVLRLAGVEYDAAYLEDVSHWIWLDEAVALLKAAAEVTDDPAVGRRVGEESVRQHAGTPVATLLRSLGSPEAVYEQLAVGVTKFSTITELIPREVAPGRAVGHVKARPGYERDPVLCDWPGGLLSQPPALFGLPPADVEETSCQSRGDAECIYEIAWDADRAASAADPQELVTALESQLVGMSDRLQNMYATARDLIAIDDLDVALARITDRAATAVRAPKYLLAVHTGPHHKLHVHHRGFVDEDPEEVARALLSDSDEGSQKGRLVANVASTKRHYGRLMAASPAGAFFPYERELLDVYARFAATVLDTATAFDEARRRDEQSRALLELSRAVAVASTREEVAERLADTVPVVVDCDRVVAFLWEEQDEALVCRAATGFTGEPDELIRTVRIRPSDTERLQQLLHNPAAEPLFFDRDTPDEFIRTMMERTRAVALVVVPIATNDRFYGVLNVSVTDGPERLEQTPALRSLLAGVVAQTATALDNARLIETMAHQARFDNLTGLLGHRAFHEALEIQLERGAGTFTLASIDIDFKLVNDLHGHPVGDEALRRVAEALRCSVREHDAVFRVGGEEFAVVMPGLAAGDAATVAERIRAEVAHAPFTLPLRVSIGLASWPADARDRDSLLARADDALYAAKRAGKDRVVPAVVAGETQNRAAAGGGRTNLLDLLRAKDPATVSHCARVAALAPAAGPRLGAGGRSRD